MKIETVLLYSALLISWAGFSVWAIDVSTIAMAQGWTLSNGFRYDTPLRLYHIGLYSIYAINLFWVLLVAYLIQNRKVR